MRFFKLVHRDVNLGIIRRLAVMIIPLIVSITQVKTVHDMINELQKYNMLENSGTIADYYLYAMSGMDVFRFDPKEYFTIPIFWFVFQIGISYFVAYFAKQDFSMNGRNLFIASKSRSLWWFSKVVWVIFSVIVYYAMMIFFTGIGAVLSGAEISLHFSREFISQVLSYNAIYLTDFDMIFIAVIIPIIVTIAVCLFQLLFSLVLTPVTSFAIVSAGYVLSAYYTSWLFIGNYTMWLRSSYVTDEGVTPYGGLIIAVGIILVVLVMGKLYIDDVDVY